LPSWLIDSTLFLFFQLRAKMLIQQTIFSSRPCLVVLSKIYKIALCLTLYIIMNVWSDKICTKTIICHRKYVLVLINYLKYISKAKINYIWMHSRIRVTPFLSSLLLYKNINSRMSNDAILHADHFSSYILKLYSFVRQSKKSNY
jgi:hypothetical protein